MSNKNQETISNGQLFSERFRNLRKQLKLSQRDLAKKLGFVSNTQLSKIENAKSEPTVGTLRKLVKIQHPTVSIDVHELITGEPSPGSIKAVKILKPFALAHLSDITAKIQTLTEQCNQLRSEGATSFELLAIDKDLTSAKVQDSAKLEELQDELERLQLYYKAILKAISEFS